MRTVDRRQVAEAGDGLHRLEPTAGRLTGCVDPLHCLPRFTPQDLPSPKLGKHASEKVDYVRQT
ncbi:hypothetical protein M2152_000776 [Microbacteriaceae bacterium SG_E_30_P1]|uniref:Uncharacterized protein n=1 Tax=Antiquaquibacter oligotrophicus TaxID=2880260 RepID=A0ABT6KN62_9MICO|nr:hypothetical protein [Antiquaquibacter oligotrophicus]